MTESSFNNEPMKRHGKELCDYSTQRIDECLEAVEHLTVEHSLGHAMMKGFMTAEEVYEYLDAYERAFGREDTP